MKRALNAGPGGSSNAGCSREPSRKMNCKHPPHLRGKQIGLFYARMNKEKKGESAGSQETPVHEVELSTEKKTHFQTLLEDLPDVFPRPFDNGQRDDSKYSHIKDSEFKRKFLKTIRGSLEAKLNEACLHKRITGNSSLDMQYRTEFQEKLSNQSYQRLLAERNKLPSYQKRDEILKLLEKNQVVVISGETGCGKTTQVAQYILDDYILSGKGSECKVVCTQPRRISAIAVAERVAEERVEKCGFCSVGYQIRLEKKLPRPWGSILYCTTGILLKQMQDDPYLSEVSHVILDEIHERNYMSDFLVALIKLVIRKRSDLKVILMSATLNSDAFSAYYDDCPKLHIPGMTYPVQTFYLEDVLSKIKHTFRPTVRVSADFRKHILPYVDEVRSRYTHSVVAGLRNPNSEEIDTELIYKLVEYISRHEPPGAILVFLPGVVDIQRLHKMIMQSASFPPSRYVVLPLHSKMSTLRQREVFDEPPQGVRKIVISTNIAETSITINDVVYVIDSGRIKVENFDVENNIQTLDNQWVSLANASQRKGRAGRVQPGKCYFMFTRAREKLLPAYQKPEILCTRLENIVLNIKILQLGGAAAFLSRLMDKPKPDAISIAIKNLQKMNALDEEERLTPLGYQLALMPIAPQLGKMILYGAWFSCLDPILSVATCLDYKDPFLLMLEGERAAFVKKLELAEGCQSDHLLYVKTLKRFDEIIQHGNVRSFCREYFLNFHTLNLLRTMKKQFAELLFEMRFIANSNFSSESLNVNSRNMDLIKAIVCGCLYPNVAFSRTKGRNKRSFIVTAEKERAEINFCSLNTHTFDAPFLVYYRKYRTSKIYIYDTTLLDPLHLILFCGKFSVNRSDTLPQICISEILKFKCAEDTVDIIRGLRHNLEALIDYKIAHPSPVDWFSNDKETRLLRLIVDFLTLDLRTKLHNGKTASGFTEEKFCYS